MPSHWHDSCHCTVTTRSSWLPGDPRGWRSRHHRDHVDGDYRNAPPQQRDRALHRTAQQAVSQPAVVIPRELRRFVLETFHGALRHHKTNVHAICVNAQHLHVLAQFPATGVAGLSIEHHRSDGLSPIPRYVLGKAMSWTTHTLKKHLRAQSPPSPDGGTEFPKGLQPLRDSVLWAARPSIKPITDERHFNNAHKYILAHKTQGAAVWPDE